MLKGVVTKQALIEAAENSDWGAIQVAIEKDGMNYWNTKKIGSDDATLAHWGAGYSTVEVLDCLVNAGFSMHVQDEDGYTPLDWAQSRAQYSRDTAKQTHLEALHNASTQSSSQ